LCSQRAALSQHVCSLRVPIALSHRWRSPRNCPSRPLSWCRPPTQAWLGAGSARLPRLFQVKLPSATSCAQLHQPRWRPSHRCLLCLLTINPPTCVLPPAHRPSIHIVYLLTINSLCSHTSNPSTKVCRATAAPAMHFALAHGASSTLSDSATQLSGCQGHRTVSAGALQGSCRAGQCRKQEDSGTLCACGCSKQCCRLLGSLARSLSCRGLKTGAPGARPLSCRGLKTGAPGAPGWGTWPGCHS